LAAYWPPKLAPYWHKDQIDSGKMYSIVDYRLVPMLVLMHIQSGTTGSIGKSTEQHGIVQKIQILGFREHNCFVGYAEHLTSTFEDFGFDIMKSKHLFDMWVYI
jgi:hypothetical protein